MRTSKKKRISLLLILSLLVLYGDLIAKERRGAVLIIQKKDGQQVKGELIAVKETSLLLLDSKTSVDVTVYFTDISSAKKTSGVGKGMSIGFLVGAGVGAMIGYFNYDEKENYNHPYKKSRARTVLYYSGTLGLVGALIGAFVGAGSTWRGTISLERKSDFEVKKVLHRLRSEARIRKL
jgi:hypothetical protein